MIIRREEVKEMKDLEELSTWILKSSRIMTGLKLKKLKRKQKLIYA